MPKISADECVSCSSCLGVCPTQAIFMDDNDKAEIDQNKCTNCGACLGTCPTGAIKE